MRLLFCTSLSLSLCPSVLPLNCFLEAGDFGLEIRAVGWSTLPLRGSPLSFYWDRGESRLYLLIPRVSVVEETPAACFKAISDISFSVINSKTNMKRFLKNRFSLKVYIWMCNNALERWQISVFSTVNVHLSVRSCRVEPNPTLRTDNLLHKPSVLCCLSTRAECMDYWWQHRASKAWHMARTTVTHVPVPPSLNQHARYF